MFIITITLLGTEKSELLTDKLRSNGLIRSIVYCMLVKFIAVIDTEAFEGFEDQQLHSQAEMSFLAGIRT